MVNTKGLIILGLLGAGFIAVGGVALTRTAIDSTRGEIQNVRNALEERRQRQENMLAESTSKES